MSSLRRYQRLYAGGRASRGGTLPRGALIETKTKPKALDPELAILSRATQCYFFRVSCSGRARLSRTGQLDVDLARTAPSNERTSQQPRKQICMSTV